MRPGLEGHGLIGSSRSDTLPGRHATQHIQRYFKKLCWRVV